MPLIKWTKILFQKKRSIKLLFFFFLIILIDITTPIQSFALEINPDSSKIKDKALELNLQQNEVWLSLLQIKGQNPQINDPLFFVELNYISPKIELLTFIHKLYSDKGHQTACRFPARYYWLKNRLEIVDYDLNLCAELNEFINRAPLQSASVIFASENISLPSSMMGHVFFKLEGKNIKNIAVSHTISFFTEINDVNFPKLIYESLISGKKGYYSLSPFEQNKNHYLFNEQRNIWEYKLRLNDYEKKLLHYYFFELKNIAFTYFFHSFNCATLVNNILTVLHPELSNNHSLWVTPLDVIRSIDNPKIVESQLMTPSSRWKIKALNENLNLTLKDKDLIRRRDFLKINLDNYSFESKIFTYELALAYNDYQFEQDAIDRSSWSHAYNSLQEHKNNLQKNVNIDISNYKNPSNSIKDSQIFLKTQYYLQNQSYIMGFLPASHALTDDTTQYQNESELKIGEISFEYRPKTNYFNLDSLIAYSATSLQPHDEFTGGLSGAFRLGLEPKLREDLVYFRSDFIEGGLGKTYRILKDVDMSILGLIGYHHNSESIFKFIPVASLIIREVYGMKTFFELKDEFRQNGSQIFNLSVSQVINRSNFSFIIKYKLNKRVTSSENFEKNFGVYNDSADGFEFSVKYFL